MGFEAPITIKRALENIQSRTYAMPAIQRGFVWSEEQIERLFDSLMQGYPIGQFLFWEVDRNTVDDHRWYGFVREYHQKDRRYNPEFEPPDQHSGLRAVLDGQQRLTALNIGLRGSYASKLPRLRRDNPQAYPSKLLYLNIDSQPEDDEFGMKYEFKFLTDDDFQTDGAETKWFRVADIIGMKNQMDLVKYLAKHRLTNVLNDADESLANDRMDRLNQLWNAVWVDKPISFFLEEEPDSSLDKVLNIFIRTNSGGTILSNSDLLLSIAVSQFETLDARREVNERTDELNEIGDGFNFSRDFVLKAGLVLADISNVRFDTRNFNRDNMQTLEKYWFDMIAAVRVTVDLASDFGLSGGRLSSQNALLPIAFYLYKNQLDDRFLTAKVYKDERETMRGFLYRSLIGRVWGGGSDSLLERLRSVIREHGQDRFPVQALTTSLAGMNRSIVFDDDQLDDIVDTEYGSQAFILLSMLYSFVNVASSRFHIDHVFPKSAFTHRSLDRTRLGSDERTEARERMNRLANLQLLEAPINVSKGNMLPYDWLEAEYDTETERQHHIDRHQLTGIPRDLSGFVDWYEVRREAMLGRLRGILGQRPS